MARANEVERRERERGIFQLTVTAREIMTAQLPRAHAPRAPHHGLVRSSALALITLATLGCSSGMQSGGGDTTRHATAALVDTAGRSVGTVDFAEPANGPVAMTVQLTNMAPGAHGIHFHAVGQCTATGAFASAGGHFNPASKHHGLENPEGPHAGDLPNVDVGADGTASVTIPTTRVTLGAGANSLLDADGSAVVVHAAADDQKSDPSGNSGARVACGVVTAR